MMFLPQRAQDPARPRLGAALVATLTFVLALVRLLGAGCEASQELVAAGGGGRGAVQQPRQLIGLERCGVVRKQGAPVVVARALH